MAGLEKDVWVRPHRPGRLHARHHIKRNRHEIRAAYILHGRRAVLCVSAEA
jgi:hypothetical protein